MQPVSFINDEDEEANLENLIKNYIKKSEELEMRESKILQQVELIHSAVISLQAWKENRKPSITISDMAPIDLKQIEEDTKKIREETQRIQEEINKKMADNKILEEVLRKKNLEESEEDVYSLFEKIVKDKKPEMEEIQSRTSSQPRPFEEKFLELEEIEKKLKEDLTITSEKESFHENYFNEILAKEQNN